MGVYDVHAGDDLYTRLTMLQAGDTVVVHAGTYTTPGFYEVTWPGTADAPIVIEAAPGEHAVLQGEADQNVINITGSYFTLDGFEITGGSHGLRLRTVSNATISNNQIQASAMSASRAISKKTATRSRSATTRSSTPVTPAPARACTSAATMDPAG